MEQNNTNNNINENVGMTTNQYQQPNSINSNPIPQINLNQQQTNNIIQPVDTQANLTNKVQVDVSQQSTKKKKNLLFLIPVVIVVAAVAIFVFKGGLLKEKPTKNINEIDYEIAKIIFSEYFEDKFDENLIESAFYDSENKEYECEYVIKEHTDFYKDSVTFRTSDFVNYSLSSVTYTKSGDSYSPHSFSANFEYISNDAKTEILKLAKEKGYHVGEIPTKEETDHVLEIVLSNDTKNIEELLKQNNYIFKGTYIDSVHLTFLYEDKNNSENYIKIKSSMSGFDYWNVYGSSNKKISEDSRYNDYFNTYIIDYYITVKTDLEKIQPVYDKYINR